MRKKPASTIKLVLISSILASCGHVSAQNAINNEQQAAPKQRLFMRADTTAVYTEVTDNYKQQQTRSGGMGSALLWYMAFRHMGGAMGYANNSLHPSSVAGTNVQKASAFKAQRGGFGQTVGKSSASS